MSGVTRQHLWRRHQRHQRPIGTPSGVAAVNSSHSCGRRFRVLPGMVDIRRTPRRIRRDGGWGGGDAAGGGWRRWRQRMSLMADAAAAAAVYWRQIYGPDATAGGGCLFTALKNDGLSARRLSDPQRGLIERWRAGRRLSPAGRPKLARSPAEHAPGRKKRPRRRFSAGRFVLGAGSCLGAELWAGGI